MERKELLDSYDLAVLRRHKKTGGNVTINKDWIYSRHACTRRVASSPEPMEVVIPAGKVQGKINELRKVGLTVVHHDPNATPCYFGKDLYEIWNRRHGNQEIVSLQEFKELFKPAKKHGIEKFGDFAVMYSDQHPNEILFGLAYEGSTDTIVLFEQR